MGKGKGGKKKGVKIPKEVAGFKLPKELRRKGEALIEQAQSPAGRVAIAKGVSAVAGLAATAAQAAARAAEAKQAKAAPVADGKPGPQGEAVAQAIGAGVEAVLGRLFPKR